MNKTVSKFVAKLFKYKILFKDILTFLGLDYINALPIVLCCPRYQSSINLTNKIFISHKKCYHLRKQHVLNKRTDIRVTII